VSAGQKISEVAQNLGLPSNFGASMGTYKLKSLELLRSDDNPNSLSDNRVNVNGTASEIKRGIIQVVYERISPSGVADTEVVKTIPVNLKFVNGDFYSCGDAQSSFNENVQTDVCGKMEGLMELNPATGLCEVTPTMVTMTCPTGEVLLGVSALGVPQCSPAEEAIDPSEVVEPIDGTGCDSTSNIQFYVSPNNKIRTRCQP
jgi:hypothetical protein